MRTPSLSCLSRKPPPLTPYPLPLTISCWCAQVYIAPSLPPMCSGLIYCCPRPPDPVTPAQGCASPALWCFPFSDNIMLPHQCWLAPFSPPPLAPLHLSQPSVACVAICCTFYQHEFSDPAKCLYALTHLFSCNTFSFVDSVVNNGVLFLY